MKRLMQWVVIVVAMAGVVRAADSTGEQRLSLDGVWNFTIDSPQKPIEQWDRLSVPGNWDTINEYAHHAGKGWYRRTFTVPDGMKGKRLRLRFEAVHESAEVKLNGKTLGSHKGGYTPFEFDISDAVKPEGDNELLVCADNSFHRGAWWPWGGISRSVNLIATNDVRLIWQHVWAEPDLKAGSASVEIEYLVGNDSAAEKTVELASQIERGGKTLSLAATQLAIPAHAQQRKSMKIALPPEQVKLWDIDHPNLYTLSTKASAGGAVQHAKVDRFGIRKIEVTKNGLYLNGEKVRLNGFNRVSDHRAFGNTEPDHLVKLDIDLMKRYGGNMMRIMHVPQSPNLLDYADEKGILLFCEIPVWGGEDPQMTPNNPVTQQWLAEMLHRDFNHPSIIGWSVGNEMTKHYDYVKSMIEYVKAKLDSHRLVTHVSLSGTRKDYTPKNDPISVSDILLYNSYGAELGKVTDTLRSKWPDKPVFFSEYGAGQFGEAYASRIKGLEERHAALANHPQVIGVSLWTFNDYRSNYKNSQPGELRSWGIFNLWRQPKAACEQVAKLYSPVADLKVEGNTLHLTPRQAGEFPSFILRDYVLTYEWIRSDGTTAAGGIEVLPTIKPGDRALQFTLPSATPPGAENLLVRLISPTGYIVHEWQKNPPAAAAAEEKATATSAPIIYRAYPLDGGFMLGYSTQKDDKEFTVEYGTESGKYTQSLTAAMPGAMRVRGLTNGQTYHARLQRTTATGKSDWSCEVTVTPDGGLKPAAPRLLGAVRKNGLVVLRFAPVEKAIGYRIYCNSETPVELNCSATGIALVRSAIEGKVSFTISTLNPNGESTPSNAIEPIDAK